MITITTFQKKLLIGLFILALLTPLGIYLPEKFNANDIWGEWTLETIQKMLGYVPEGMKKTGDLWKAPMPDYSFAEPNPTFLNQAISYIASAVVGISIITIIIYLIIKIISNHNKIR